MESNIKNEYDPLNNFKKQIQFFYETNFPHIFIDCKSSYLFKYIIDYICNVVYKVNKPQNNNENVKNLNKKINGDYVNVVNCIKKNNSKFIKEELILWIKNSFGYTNINNIPFRLIFLLYPENLTLQSQGALRRIIEINSKHNRFIFLSSKKDIIKPLLSRTTEIYISNSKTTSLLDERNKINNKILTNEILREIETICVDILQTNKLSNLENYEQFLRENYNRCLREKELTILDFQSLFMNISLKTFKQIVTNINKSISKDIKCDVNEHIWFLKNINKPIYFLNDYKTFEYIISLFISIFE